jgi:hypothetical protein
VAHKALVRIVFERDAFCSINVLYAAVLTIGIMRVWVSKLAASSRRGNASVHSSRMLALPMEVAVLHSASGESAGFWTAGRRFLIELVVPVVTTTICAADKRT